MAELLKCIECNGLVSSEANLCPHCNSSYYKGVVCRCCDQIMKYSQQFNTRVEFYLNYNQKESASFSGHKSCFERVYAKSLAKVYCNINCPLCSHSITVDRDKVFDYENSNCRKCGNKMNMSQIGQPFAKCYYCNLRLISQSEINFQIYDKFGNYLETHFSHKECFTSYRSEKINREIAERTQRSKEFEEQRVKKEREEKVKIWWANNGRNHIIGIVFWLIVGFFSLNHIFWLSIISLIYILYALWNIFSHL